MALFRRNALLLSALLLIGVPGLVRTENDIEDGVTIETVEEDAEEYHSPQVDSKKVFLAEHFDDQKAFDKKWIRSEAKKQGVDENIAKYDGKWELQTPSRKILRDDMGLVLTTEAKHAAISTLLDRPFEFKDKPFIVQYEVTMQEGQNCGGAYLKLLSKGTSTKADLRKFHDQTAYSIMFGPDKCGNDNKLHFIFRHRNPKNGSFEEKHSKKPTQRLDEIYKDKEPHLYTLIVRPDNSFTILVDNKEVNSGSLLEDFTPAVNPPEEIDDPNDKKPADWDDREMIVDPSATKPDDWDEEAPAQIVDPNAAKPSGWLDDEPLMISDPEAKKPEDWDDDMDGEWEAPLIDNPACESAPGCGEWKPPLIANPEYKGIWRAPLINNPQYSGKWSPRRIPNPDFFKDEHPFRMTPIHAVGFELWSMSPMLLFDNLIITDDPAVAEMWALQGFALKRAKLSRDSQTLWGRMVRAMNYKPGYWAMYGVYVAIPIVVYIAYVLRWAKDSVIDRALQYASDNPWVYAVAVLGTVLVVGFVLYLCSGSSKSDVEEINDPKKTDAFVEDDEHHSEGDEAAEDEQEDESEAERPRNKADLEGPAAQDSEKRTLCKKLQTEIEAAAKKLKDDDKEKQKLDKTLQTEKEAAAKKLKDDQEETPLVDTEGAGDAQRKRKPRKE